MFHYKDGIYFKREDNGSVTVIKKESAHYAAKTITEFNIDPDGWCSIIATVSDKGETSEKWEEANKFHGNPNK